MAVKGALDAALQTFRPHSAALRSPTSLGAKHACTR